MTDDMERALLERLMFVLMKQDVPNLDGNKVPTWRYPCYGQKQTATNTLPQVENRTL